MKNFFSFLNENISIENLNVGDRVSYYGPYNHKKEFGKILNIDNDEKHILIEFDNHWDELLHNGNSYAVRKGIETYTDNCYYYYDKEFRRELRYIELEKNIKKIKNPELDPFDEENWGYIKEE